MIVISAKQSRGFWCCAVFHPADAVEHDDKKFSAAQLAELQAESMLNVQVIPVADPAKKPATK